jgi:hypothetical protein
VSFTYAYARLERAVEELVSSADIRSRLDAATKTLTPVFAEDFPGERGGEFKEIYESLNWLPGDASLEAMNDKEAENLARRLLSLYIAASRTLSEGV